MSSKDSSNRVDSGNAFEGDSPSPSSLEGGQTPEISWMESSQHDSASQEHEVAEEGERGYEEASSSDQAEWSCADLVSTFTLRDAHRIATQHCIEVALPQEIMRAYRPPTRHITTSWVFLKFGVRFPIHTCFRNILNYYNLTVFQVTPNGWAHMIELFVEQKMDPPTPEAFSWFYTFKSSKGDIGFYYFSKRATKEVQTVNKIKESLGNWKDAYFFTPEASVRGHFAEPSKLLLVSFLRILYVTCRLLF